MIGFNGAVTVHDLVKKLPAPQELRYRCERLAMLEALWGEDYRSYGFEVLGRDYAVAEYDSGAGDRYRIIFDKHGVFGFGFDHESPCTPWREEPRVHWPDLLTGLPEEFAVYPQSPGYQVTNFFDATVCFWRLNGDSAWGCGPVEFDRLNGDNDGADWLFAQVADWNPAKIAEHIGYYWGVANVDVEAVGRICNGEPLTRELVLAINPNADYPEVTREARLTGYPVDGPSSRWGISTS